MRPRVNRFMMAIFFLCLGGFLIWSAMQRPRVFVLQSYTRDYAWTRDVDDAIRNVFSGKPYDVKYHYMDTKRHSGPEFKRIAGALARKRINEWKPDVLIAVDDNAQSLVATCYMGPETGTAASQEAQALFGKCYDDHRELAVVFAGVGAQLADYGYVGQDNVTGILERIDIRALKRTLEIIAPEITESDLQVWAPIDDSTSGDYNQGLLEQLSTELAKTKSGITLKVRREGTFSEWQAMVNEANDKAHLLLFSNYHTVIKCRLRVVEISDANADEDDFVTYQREFPSNDRDCAVLIMRASGKSEQLTVAGFDDARKFRTVVVDDPSHELSRELEKDRPSQSKLLKLAAVSLGRTLTRVPPSELIACMEASSRIPGIGAWGFYVEDGGMLSVGVSPFEQGETAARLAVEILDHDKNPKALAVETTRQSLVYMRESLMRYHSLELPPIYEAFARATGHYYGCKDRDGDCGADISCIADIKRRQGLPTEDCADQRRCP